MVLRHTGNGYPPIFFLTKGQVKFLIVVIDYFTTWTKTEPLAHTSPKVLLEEYYMSTWTTPLLGN